MNNRNYPQVIRRPVPQSRRLRGLQPDHGPCTKDCADYALQQVRPILRNAGYLPYQNPPLLAGLMGALYPGSRVRVGFEFNWSPNLGYDPADREAQLVSEIKAVLINYLNDGIVFNDVNVAVNPLPGWFSSGYITIEATTKTELPDANTFADMCEYGIRTYLLTVQITRRDEALVDYVAPAARNQPGVQQAGPATVCDWNTMDFRDFVDCQLGIGKFSKSQTPTTTVQGQPRTPQAPLAPGECDFSRQSFGDWLSCSLGLKSVTGGAAAGASLGVVLVAGAALLFIVASRR